MINAHNNVHVYNKHYDVHVHVHVCACVCIIIHFVIHVVHVCLLYIEWKSANEDYDSISYSLNAVKERYIIYVHVYMLCEYVHGYHQSVHDAYSVIGK